jgi:MFS family permease
MPGRSVERPAAAAAGGVEVSGPSEPALGARWGSLAVPNYRTYFLGTAVAQSSTWLLRTAQSWLVLDLTGSPAALGLLALVQFLPVTILTLFAGVLLDRVATRRLLLVTQSVTVLQAVVLAALVATQQVRYWEVLVLSAALGIANAFDQPARSVMVGQLVGPGRVGNAVALNSTIQQGARIVGPGLGGVMIATWGTGACFAAAAAASLGGLAGLVFLRADRLYPKRRARSGAVLSQLREGLAYAFSSPTLGFNIVLMAFLGTFAYNWNVVLPALARYALDAGAEGFGVLNMAMGIGSVIGGLLLATRVRASLRLVIVTAALYAAMLGLVGMAPTMGVALVQLLVVGVLSILYSAGSNTMLQLEARDEFRGRVMSLFMLLWAGTTPFGSAFTGLVAGTWDVRLALEINGALSVAGVILACGYLVLARRPVGDPRRSSRPAR